MRRDEKASDGAGIEAFEDQRMITVVIGSNRKSSIKALVAALMASAATVAGFGATGHNGAGALVSGSSSVAGAGVSKSTGSGALAAQASHVAGAGNAGDAVSGNGALAAQSSSVAGAGVSKSTGIGALAAQSSAVAGAGVSKSTGTGALAAQASSVAGAGTASSSISGTGALAAQASSVAGAGVSKSTGTGALAAQSSSVAGVGGNLVASAYTNFGGTGDRTTVGARGAPIAVTSTLTISGGGAFSNLCDGGFGNNTSDSFKVTSVAVSGLVVVFDFTNTGARIINEFKFYQDTSDSHGVWHFQGSMDGSSYTTLRSSLTLGGAATNTYTVANTTKYLFYRLLGVSGNTSATPFWQEVEFKINGNPLVDLGNRTATMTASTTFASSGGTISNLVDGGFNNNGTDSYGFTGEAASGKIVKVDLGSGNNARVTGFTWWQQTSNSHGVYNFSGSNDDSAWTVLLTGLTLGGALRSRYDVTNTVQYRYYRLIGTSGNTSGTPWLQEWEFETE